MKQQTLEKNSLDILNKRYQKRCQMQKRQQQLKRIIVGVLAAALVVTGSILAVIRKSDAEEIRELPEGLPEAEAENWKNKEVDKEQFFISLNTALTVSEGNREANLSIMNPPYSAYDFRIKIAMDDEDESILYHSEVISPGTYLQTVTFQKELLAGQYEATVYYTFYGDREDIIIAEHMVPITIEVSKK